VKGRQGRRAGGGRASGSLRPHNIMQPLVSLGSMNMIMSRGSSDSRVCNGGGGGGGGGSSGVQVSSRTFGTPQGLCTEVEVNGTVYR